VVVLAHGEGGEEGSLLRRKMMQERGTSRQRGDRLVILPSLLYKEKTRERERESEKERVNDRNFMLPFEGERDKESLIFYLTKRGKRF
jgi:hypothetical protein